MPLLECNLQIYSAYTFNINVLYVLLQEILKGFSVDTDYEVLNQETSEYLKFSKFHSSYGSLTPPRKDYEPLSSWERNHDSKSSR